MSTQFTKNDNNTVTLTTVVDAEATAKAEKKAINKAAAHMNLKGFRKGKVPTQVVKKYFGADGITSMAAEELSQAALNSMLDEYDVEPIDRPTLDFKKNEDGTLELTFIVPVAPEAKLGEWKNLGIEKKTVEISDEDVENAVKSIAKKDAEMVAAEDGEEAKEGDFVEIDFVGTVDGEAFPGGTANNVSVVIGNHEFIPGFEEGLVGMKSGESKDIEVTFPEDYQAAELAGKKAVFHVTAHDIYHVVLPELNDDFAKNQKDIPNMESVDQLRETIKTNMTNNAQAQADDEYMTALFAAIRGNAEVDIPEVMINDEVDALIRELNDNMRQSGLALDQYLKFIGQTVDNLRENLKGEAETRVFNTLVLEAIAKAENLSVSDEELDKEIAEYAEKANMPVETLKSRVDLKKWKHTLLLDKATEAMVDAQ